MEHYKNLSGQSGMAAYEIASNSIKVQFKDGHTYFYTYDSAGSGNIERMKSLAVGGRGLNSFINTTVRKAYASKW